MSTEKYRHEARVRRAVGKVSTSLANYYSVERIGGNLLITVKMEFPPPVVEPGKEGK